MSAENVRFVKRVLTFFLLISSPFFYISCSYLEKFISGPEILYEKYDNLEYRLLKYRPNRSISKKMPLVLLLHGAQQEPENMLALWADEAEKRHVMVLAPRWTREFETQRAAEENRKILALLKQVQAQYPVDPGRIYLAGISAGGDKALHVFEISPEQWRGLILMAFIPSESWIQEVDSRSIPPLLFTLGGKDRFNHYETLMNAAGDLKGKKIPVKLLVDPDAGHEYLSAWNGAVFEWMEETKKKAPVIDE